METYQIEVNYKGLPLLLCFEYQPAEPEVTYYSDGSGYPGCGDYMEFQSIEIITCKNCENIDISELLTEKDYRNIEDLIYAYWEEQSDYQL